MKILHIDETFHPSYGYHTNPLARFNKFQGNEVAILSAEENNQYLGFEKFGKLNNPLNKEDEKYESISGGVKIFRVVCNGYIMGRINYNKNELFKKIDEINPDVIFMHCVETLTAMRVMLKYKNKYPIVFDSHMLEMASSNKLAKIYEIGYRIVFTSLIKRKNFLIIRTQKDNYVIKHLGIPIEQAPYISFGTDTSIFKPKLDLKKEFLQKNNLSEDSFIIVSTGKLDEGKGGMLLAQALKNKFDSPRKIIAIIVANFEGEYEQKVKETLHKSENQIFYYGIQNYMNLPWFYQVSDVCVFPKQCSMSFFDAQACGLPVISEDNNINIERNSHGNGFCFKAGDIDDFRKKIEYVINLNPEEYKKISKNSYNYILENFDYKDISEKYMQILINSYNRFHHK